jgi:formate hydrogenlyase subunit 4
VSRFAGLAAALLLAPLLPGVISRTKAFFAGRVGPPLLQPYFDLAKLLRKGAVYSGTTTWVFRAGPVVGLAAVLVATAIAPFGGVSAPLAFAGDFLFFAGLLGVMRFVTMLAALDTGSSFEGMGASREAQFAALAEPAFLLGLTAVAWKTGGLSLSGMLGTNSFAAWSGAAAPLALVCVSLLVVFLAENARIPVDDPNTHLELTMIHEVMVLDHGGPDLALIQYAGALKLWVLGSLVVGVALPVRSLAHGWAFVASVAGMLGLCVVVGVVESCLARLRLTRVPQLLLGAGVLSLLALFIGLK